MTQRKVRPPRPVARCAKDVEDQPLQSAVPPSRRVQWLVPREERPFPLHGRRTVEDIMSQKMDMLDLICTWSTSAREYEPPDWDSFNSDPTERRQRSLSFPSEAQTNEFVPFITARKNKHRQ